MTTKRKPRSRRDTELTFDITETWKPLLKEEKKKKRRGKEWKK